MKLISTVKFVISWDRIGRVMGSVLASSAVDRGFEIRSGQTKDYKIGICCFSAKPAALRRKRKDWLARDQNNVSEWSDMSTRLLRRTVTLDKLFSHVSSDKVIN